MSTREDEASVQSREYVCRQLTMSDTMSAKGNVVEAQRGKTACAWAQREQVMRGARERMSVGVMAQRLGWNGFPLGGAECDQRTPR